MYLAYDIPGTVFLAVLILILSGWTRLWTSFFVVSMDELSQLSLPYQYLNLLLEGVTIFSGVTMVAVETTVKVLRSFRKV